MNLPLDGIAAFLAVLRTGSLSGAARRLGLAQPTVRAQVADLERRLGAPLFTRSRSGLAPTERARGLRARAEAVEAAAAAFGRAASGAPGAISGRVRLTASRVMAALVLPEILAPLLAAAPGLTVELAATDAVEDLTRAEADIALRLAEPRQAALVAKRLRPVALGVFATAGIVAEHGPPADAADLLGRYPFVSEDRGRRIAEGLAGAGLPVPARVAIATDDDVAAALAVGAGLGAGILQVRIGGRMGLTRLLPDLGFALPLWAAMHEDLRPSAPVRAVFEHLAAELG
ncbi:MAG: LysR family transcriptional regulator [Paracoccaceae bacterium]